jgi:hypothetical protein
MFRQIEINKWSLTKHHHHYHQPQIVFGGNLTDGLPYLDYNVYVNVYMCSNTIPFNYRTVIVIIY